MSAVRAERQRVAQIEALARYNDRSMDRQPDLFASHASPIAPTDPARARAAIVVAPATARPEHQRLANALPNTLHLGTSSWAFPGWASLVYGGATSEAVLARRGLTAYSQHPLLSSVAIDRSFYAPLTAAQFAEYAAQVPRTFRFVTKAPAAVTDPLVREVRGKPTGENPEFLNATKAVDEFVGPALEGLGAKAGVLLFQFSPAPNLRTGSAVMLERLAPFLEAVCAAADRSATVVAIEVRDRSLLSPRLAEVLNAVGARYSFSVHGRMPSLAAQALAMARLAPGAFVARWNLPAGHSMANSEQVLVQNFNHRGGGQRALRAPQWAIGTEAKPPDPRTSSPLTYDEAKAHYAPFNRIVDPDPSTRAALAELARRSLDAGEHTYVIVNNKAEGSAPLSVFALAAVIAA